MRRNLRVWRRVYLFNDVLNGCLLVTKGYCDMDPDTLECYESRASHVDEPLSGLCCHMIMSTTQEVKDQHEDCVGNSYNQEPPIGTEGEICQYDKPATSTMVQASTR